MTARNLSTVTTDLIVSYGSTVKNVIHAYRVGNERVIGFMDQRWESALRKSGAKLKPEVRGNALSAQQEFSGYYIKGITLTTAGADTVVDKVVELASKGVHRIAANAGHFEKRTGVTVLNKLAVVAAPAVEAVIKLADKLEQKSELLSNKLAGKDTTVELAAVKRVTPFKKARSQKPVRTA